ncbi:MAG: amino acid adenylation domain-containing protein, partial [Bacteroidetes bacterium]
MPRTNLVEFFDALTYGSKGVKFAGKSSEIQELSYRDLNKKVNGVIHRLQDFGLKPGDEVIFQFSSNQHFVVCFWASLKMGLIPIPINPATNPETRFKLKAVWNSLGNPFIVADEDISSKLFNKLITEDMRSFSRDRVLLLDSLDERELAPEMAHEVKADDIAFIQFSSGSTGNPKGVCLSHANLLANIEAIIEGAELREDDSTLGWMPLTHDLGLIGFHLTPLVRGIDQIIMETETFVRRPDRWMELINHYRISFTASPNFGYKHFMNHSREESRENWDLSCVRRILNGAEPISVELCRDFLDFMTPYGLRKEVMFPVYGMAEASLAVTFPEVDRPFDSIRIPREQLTLGEKIQSSDEGIEIISVGKAVKHCEIQVCNENHVPLSDGQIGHIKIRGKNVTKGYYRNQEANREVFDEDQWLLTGDIGFVLEGQLYITGRSKDIIFSNGLNIYPHDLERIAEQASGIESGRIAFAGVPRENEGGDQILCFIVHRGKLDQFPELLREVKQLISSQVAIDIDSVIPVQAIPKTTSGKLQRYQLAKQYAEGEFNTVIEELRELMSQRAIELPVNELEQGLMDLWNEELDGKIKSTNDHFFEFGGNSIKASMVCAKIAREFSVEISIRELFKSPRIKSLAGLIQDKQHERFEHIPIVSERRYYPCSSAQKRLYILNQLNPEKTDYNISSLFKLDREANQEKLKSTIHQLMERHPILRTNFVTIEGEPVQVVRDTKDVMVPQTELDQSISATEQIQGWIKPFDLEKDLLFRLIQFSDRTQGGYYLLFDIHHIVLDGYALNQLVSEFSALYNGKEATKQEGITFKDFAAWEADFLKTSQIKTQEEFWLNEFKTIPDPISLPTDFPRKNKIENRAESHYFEIDTNQAQKIEAFARQMQATPFHIFLGAFAWTLHHYAGNEEVVIGTPIINRPHPDLEHCLGTFINTLPFRINATSELNGEKLISQIRDKALDIYSNQNFPFERLVDSLDLSRDLQRNPLFDVLFVYQNALNDQLELGDIQVTREKMDSSYAKFDLNIHVHEEENSFWFLLEYNADLFTSGKMERFGKHFKEFLDQLTDSPTTQLSELSLGTKRDFYQLPFKKELLELKENDAQERFQRMVAMYPNSPAFAFEEDVCTYLELDQIANYYAQKITAEIAPEPSSLIGISFRDPSKVAPAMLACWKAGCAFVPIDPFGAKERNEFIIQNAGLSFLFTDEPSKTLKTVDISGTNKLESFKSVRNSGTNPAYVIYTSGTTGRPKGTLIPHKALCNYVSWLNERMGVFHEDQALMLSSYAFDLGYTSLFGMLLNGACLHWLSEEDRKEPSTIVSYLAQQGISFLKTSPSQLNTLIHTSNASLLAQAKKLKQVFVGGEMIRAEDLLHFKELCPQVRFVNHYGPTEATIGCIATDIEDIDEFSKEAHIGRPILNTEIKLLDPNLQEVPLGAVGEICVSGAGLSIGYLNEPEQEAQRFVNVDKNRFYRTGDLARISEQGHLVLLGRNDDQVKIRGYRVEPKEIENFLKTTLHFEEVIVRGEKADGETHRLVAYIVANQLDAPTLRKQIGKVLPEYMVPEHFVSIQEIPLTPNGKLDTSRLPDYRQISAKTTRASISDFSPEQQKLRQIWLDILHLEEIDLQGHFFHLGGHSLKANVMISRIHKEFHVELKLRDVFEYPIFEDLFDLIQSKNTKSYQEIVPAELAEYYPTTSAQYRMYVLNDLQGTSLAYNMSAALEVEGNLDLEQMQTTFERLITRHESLRTSFTMIEGEVMQKVHEEVDFKIEQLPEVQNAEDTIRNFILPFDLGQAPLFRVGIGRLESGNSLMIFDMHHIISDGSSMAVLIQDFVALSDHQKLAPLPVHYKDFAVWQQQYIRGKYYRDEKKYWTEKFRNDIPLLNLPTDFKRPKQLQHLGESFEIPIDRKLSQQIKAFTKRKNITLFTLLSSCYALLLAKKSNQQELVIGTPIAGRFHSDLQGLVGAFLNMLPLRFDLNLRESFDSFLEHTQEMLLRDMEHQHFPFDQLLDELKIDRNLNRNPLYDVMIVVQNMDLKELKTKELSFHQLPYDNGFSQLDLSLFVFERGEEIELSITFNKELFRRESVDLFMKHYLHLLEFAISNEDRQLGTLEFLLPEEKEQILGEFNDTAHELASNVTLRDLFEEQAT